MLFPIVQGRDLGEQARVEIPESLVHPSPHPAQIPAIGRRQEVQCFRVMNEAHGKGRVRDVRGQEPPLRAQVAGERVRDRTSSSDRIGFSPSPEACGGDKPGMLLFVRDAGRDDLMCYQVETGSFDGGEGRFDAFGLVL